MDRDNQHKRTHELTDAEWMQLMHEQMLAKDAEKHHEIGG